MAGVMTDAFADWMLQQKAAISAAKSLRCKLYTNDYTPTPSSLDGDFTEATFAGYSPASVDNWDAPVQIGPGVWRMTHPWLVYTPTAPYVAGEQIYGYYLRDEDDRIWYAERFAGGPYLVGSSPANFLVALTWTESDH
jgi:hypothetical protein